MTDKIKLIIATNILDIGGAERAVQTLALNLDRSLFDITILCLRRGGPRLKALERAGVKVLVGDGTIAKIKELIPHPNVDILHFHRSGQREGALHGQVVDYLRPKKLMETNIFAFRDPELGPKFDLQIFKSKMMLCERVWGGAVPNPAVCLKQRVIYNPVTVDYFDQFRLAGEERARRRLELGVGVDDVLIGRVGRDDTVKWGDLILTALPEIFKTNPRVKALFRTVPAARLSWLKRRNFFNGRVIVLPESSSEKEIAETYQLLDIYAHTSRRGEAFGNSLNEAMVWSLPIVVENTPHWDNGQLEQVDNGKTGFIVKSAAGLAEAVVRLNNDSTLRRELGVAGRVKVSEYFGVRRGIEQYELAYRQLLGLVSPNEALKRIFPAEGDLIAFSKRYPELKKLDYPHRFNLYLELKRQYDYWRWRVVDSLGSRFNVKF